jgi:hypothetical protein
MAFFILYSASMVDKYYEGLERPAGLREGHPDCYRGNLHKKIRTRIKGGFSCL